MRIGSDGETETGNDLQVHTMMFEMVHLLNGRTEETVRTSVGRHAELASL